MTGRFLLSLAPLCLLAACGDDLESRQSAVQERQPMGGEITITPATRSPTARIPDEDAAAQGFTEEDELEEEEAIDAGPESLIDSAEGFSTDPIDDTSGFDPTPADDSGFAPDTLGAEELDD